MSVMTEMIAAAQREPLRVVLPEGGEDDIVRAAALAAERGIARPILIGRPVVVEAHAVELGITLDGIEIVDPDDLPKIAEYAHEYASERGYPEAVAAKILAQPLSYAAMMVHSGDADGMVAGLAHATEDVIMASELVIGLEPGVSTPSSCFLMDIPGFEGSEGSLLLFADPAVNPEPNAAQLADIAVATAGTARVLLRWEPRVALLSFSTCGSAEHPLVDKVTRALEIVRDREPELKIDGELQLDAAIVPDVAARKVRGGSDVAGVANVLIFPGLEAANIGSKLVERLAGAKAIGPLLQGFARPVSDLSRGAAVEDIIGSIAMVVVRGQQA
ncbi:MAG: phosphate acetyltransferase [Actinobacteria bacterium HGW-Actinobacteria-1]|jgi:phosphate acetyltransferase|nr:MAG: phosphate acetyltransferase [Actinobacteria bacterium HGW-Actinobacteria-1]